MLKLGTVLALAAVLYGSSALADDISPEAEAEIRQIVREYLLEHPEVILEAVAVLEQRQAAEAAEAQAQALGELRDALERNPDSPVSGNPDGDVTIVEFFDYNCSFCRRAVPVIHALLESDAQIRYVYKEFPILAESSMYSARLALAVSRLQPQLYEPLHNALLSTSGALDEGIIDSIAESVGVDLELTKAEIADPSIQEEIDRNLQLAQLLGINGTPTFVIGDAVLAGLQDIRVLEQAVDDVRNK